MNEEEEQPYKMARIKRVGKKGHILENTTLDVQRTPYGWSAFKIRINGTEHYFEIRTEDLDRVCQNPDSQTTS